MNNSFICFILGSKSKNIKDNNINFKKGYPGWAIIEIVKKIIIKFANLSRKLYLICNRLITVSIITKINEMDAVIKTT